MKVDENTYINKTTLFLTLANWLITLTTRFAVAILLIVMLWTMAAIMTIQ